MSIYDLDYIQDHYRNPCNYGTLENPDVHWEEVNPLCGDKLAMDLHIIDDCVTEVRFLGKGCVISQATASMLSEMIEGRTLDEVRALGKEEVLEALGIPISPARTKCAFLSLRVLHRGLAVAGLEKPSDDDEEL
jgi:nitrogen fixation NifU-like protein